MISYTDYLLAKKWVAEKVFDGTHTPEEAAVARLIMATDSPVPTPEEVPLGEAWVVVVGFTNPFVAIKADPGYYSEADAPGWLVVDGEDFGDFYYVDSVRLIAPVVPGALVGGEY